jgi:Ubiquitin family
MRLHITPANMSSPNGMFSVVVNDNSRVYDIKTKIMEKTGIERNEQELYFNGLAMTDTASIHYYGIQDCALISLVAFHISTGGGYGYSGSDY